MFERFFSFFGFFFFPVGVVFWVILWNNLTRLFLGHSLLILSLPTCCFCCLFCLRQSLSTPAYLLLLDNLCSPFVGGELTPLRLSSCLRQSCILKSWIQPSPPPTGASLKAWLTLIELFAHMLSACKQDWVPEGLCSVCFVLIRRF